LDDETLTDTLEGITDLHKMIAAVIRSALVDEALGSGLRARLEDMKERQARLEVRASKKRELALQAMCETGLAKLEQPDFTASIRGSSKWATADHHAADRCKSDRRMDRHRVCFAALKRSPARWIGWPRHPTKWVIAGFVSPQAILLGKLSPRLHGSDRGCHDANWGAQKKESESGAEQVNDAKSVKPK
jgi:hypothetical protein